MIELIPRAYSSRFMGHNENKFFVFYDDETGNASPIYLGVVEKCYEINPKWKEAMVVYEGLNNKERKEFDVPVKHIFSHYKIVESLIPQRNYTSHTAKSLEELEQKFLFLLSKEYIVGGEENVETSKVHGAG